MPISEAAFTGTVPCKYGEGSSSIMEDVSVYDERKKIVDQHLAEIGAKIVKEERIRD